MPATSTASLAHKMKLKPDARAAVINAPPGYLEELVPPEGVTVATNLKGQFDWVQIFVKNQAELAKVLDKAAASLKPVSLLWISFPKGTSKIQTDLTRDKGWDRLKTMDLRWVNLVSVNDTWSAFAVRPYKPGEARQDWG